MKRQRADGGRTAAASGTAAGPASRPDRRSRRSRGEPGAAAAGGRAAPPPPPRALPAGTPLYNAAGVPYALVRTVAATGPFPSRERPYPAATANARPCGAAGT